MSDRDTAAAARFYAAIRDFAVRIKPWQSALWHDVTPDEVMDPTLISQRVYGRRDEYLAVMAASGVSITDQGIPMKRIAMPTEGQLLSIKRLTGFESIADYRERGAPTWMA